MVSLALLLLALIAGAFGADSTATVSVNGLSFNGNVSIDTSDDRFDFRQSSLVSTAGLGFVVYESLGVAASGSGAGGSANVDAVVGIAFASPLPLLNVFGPPAAYLAYFDASASFDIADLNLETRVDGSAGVVGKVFVKVEEVSSETVVKTALFKDRAWTLGQIKTSGPNGELKYATFTSDQDGFEVEITVAVSSVLGKLNVGDATITPTSLESFIEIHNYPYANPQNHLRLTLFLGHAAAQASSTFKSTNTIIAGTGKEQIYIKLDGSAVVDGKSVSVTVDGLTKTDLKPTDMNSAVFSGQLTASGDLTAEVRQITVDFPAGAVDISYDPSIGFGAPNAAGLLLPSFGALLLSIAVFFFAF